VEPAHSIGKLGFRRWYERQLIESHAWLVTCFLCGLVIAASLEALSFKESVFQSILMLGFAYAAGVMCWFALKRYGSLMSEAKRLAARSSCPACDAYGAFRVIAEYPKISVRCHRCSHEWQID
jgi:hypothetical protein